MRLLLGLLLLVSCTQENNLNEISMSQKQLIDKIGAPSSVEESEVSPGDTLLRYPKNISYQVTDGVVVAKFFTPKKEESLIQSWRHNLAEYAYTIISIDNLTSKLSCPDKGVEVFFDSKSGKVFRLALYEVKGGPL